jgi:RNA polymerase sigma-70 factor (ECF subfamily)
MAMTLHPSKDRVAQFLDESSFLYAFIASRVGNDRALAEDLTQEALLAALQGAYDPAQGSLRAWLIGIAIRKIVDRQRRERSDRRHQAAVAHELGTRMTRGLLPADWIERQEVRSLVNEALSQLPPSAAALLARKYVDGASGSELALERGATEKAIEGQLGRARVMLHEAIERLSRGEDVP